MSKKNTTSFVPYAKPEENKRIPKIMSKKVSDLTKDPDNIAKKLAVKKLHDLLNGEIEPEIDYHGCDHFFLMYFVTPAMDYDFPLVANEFLRHEYNNLKEYDTGYYIDYYAYKVSPVKMIQNRILNLMYCAAKQNNTYAVTLFKTLYKTYYKKEYKQLKRFRSMSVGEVMAITGNDLDDLDSEMAMGALARTLTMAKFFDIELKIENIFLYRYMNYIWDEFQKLLDDEEELLSVPQETYEQVSEELEKLKSEENVEEKQNQADHRAMEFVESALQYMGYPFDYAYRLDERGAGINADLIRVAAILKTENPAIKYSLDEMRVYAVMLMLIRGICNQMNDQDVYLDQMLGIDPGLEDEEHLFCPEMMGNVSPNKQEKNQSVVKVSLDTEKSEKISDMKDNVIFEMEELRNKLKQKERELKTVQARYAESRDELNFLRVRNREYEKEHDELVALRDHVYKFTEQLGESPKQTVDISEMKETIQDKALIIVGGNENWVKKLRQEFPNWKYIKANASPTVASMPITNADRVYFFTDTMGHSNYYKFMQVVRDHKVPFSYIHGVNIESNIRQIYGDLIQ